MIKNGDRVLVGLSGGKDSLTLLHVLKQYQFMAGKNGVIFDLAAVTVDPMTDSYDPTPLIPYLEALEVPYFYEKQDIIGEAKRVQPKSMCSFCSRLKRGRLYHTMQREGYNVLALGQHLDDLCESFMMGAFHNGWLQTMKVSYPLKNNKTEQKKHFEDANDKIEGLKFLENSRVIRPMCYVRETATRSFAEGCKLPIIPENCPACFEQPKERNRMKQLLAHQELLYPRLFDSLQATLRPLMRRTEHLCRDKEVFDE